MKHKKKKLKTSFLVTDTTFIKNYLGVDNLGKNPTDRGRKANKLSIIINDQNIPLSLPLPKANIHYSRTLIHTIKNIKDLKKITVVYHYMQIRHMIIIIVIKS
mgnify:CR=1 FL=1